MIMRKTVPYYQWVEGVWDDYEVVGYEFTGQPDIPTSVELKKVIEENQDDNTSTGKY